MSNILAIINIPVLESPIRELQHWYDVTFSQRLRPATLRSKQPQILITDTLTLNNLHFSFADLTEFTSKTSPQTRILLLAFDLCPILIHSCLQHDIGGYLYMGDPMSSKLKLAIDPIMRGEQYISPSVIPMIKDWTHIARRNNLKERDVILLEGLAHKKRPRDIALEQHVPTNTVHQWFCRLRRKLGARNNAELLEIVRRSNASTQIP